MQKKETVRERYCCPEKKKKGEEGKGEEVRVKGGKGGRGGGGETDRGRKGRVVRRKGGGNVHRRVASMYERMFGGKWGSGDQGFRGRKRRERGLRLRERGVGEPGGPGRVGERGKKKRKKKVARGVIWNTTGCVTSRSGIVGGKRCGQAKSRDGKEGGGVERCLSRADIWVGTALKGKKQGESRGGEPL